MFYGLAPYLTCLRVPTCDGIFYPINQLTYYPFTEAIIHAHSFLADESQSNFFICTRAFSINFFKSKLGLSSCPVRWP